MTSKIVFVSGASVVAATAVAYLSWSVNAGPREARASNAASETLAPVQAATNDAAEANRLQTELLNLRGQVKDVRSQLSLVQSDLNQRKPADEAQAEPASPEEVEARRAEAKEQRHEYMAGVDAAFQREPRDAAWADSVTGFVEQKLRTNPALAGAGPVDCRASTCRVELERDEAGDTDKQLPVFLSSLGQTLSSAEADYQVKDGKGRYTFFLKDPSRAPAGAGGK